MESTSMSMSESENEGQSESQSSSSSSSPPAALSLSLSPVKISSASTEEMISFNSFLSYQKLSGDAILVSLLPTNQVYITGKAKIKVYKGKIELFGYVLTPEDPPTEIFSPRGHSSLLYIQALSEEETELREFPKWNDEVFDSLSIEDVGHIPGAVFALRSFENEWTAGFRATLPDSDYAETLVGPRYSHGGIGSRRLPEMQNFTHRFGFQLVDEHENRMTKAKGRLLKVTPEWSKVFDGLANNLGRESSICIFGGKGVGKSTFTRWLANKYLSQMKMNEPKSILYIDLDPGQTEFNPPGLLAIHLIQDAQLGPNFTHMQQPKRAVFLGGVNVSDFPGSYARAVVQLFEFAQKTEEFASIPWIINTMGFCTGLGIDLALAVINIFRPQTVIQMTIADNPQRSFPFDLSAKNVSEKSINSYLSSSIPQQFNSSPSAPLTHQFIQIETVCGHVENVPMTHRQKAAAVNQWGQTPKVLRDIMLISYFSDIIGSTLSLTLHQVVPHRFNLCKTRICVTHPRSPLDFPTVIRSAMANLVALCRLRIPQPEAQADAEPGQSMPSADSSAGLKPLPVISAYKMENDFIGYGIVSLYEASSCTLSVMTPLSDHLLSLVNVIIPAGKVGLPTSIVKNENTPANANILYLDPSERETHLDATTKRYYNPGKSVMHFALAKDQL